MDEREQMQDRLLDLYDQLDNAESAFEAGDINENQVAALKEKLNRIKKQYISKFGQEDFDANFGDEESDDSQGGFDFPDEEDEELGEEGEEDYGDEQDSEFGSDDEDLEDTGENFEGDDEEYEDEEDEDNEEDEEDYEGDEEEEKENAKYARGGYMRRKYGRPLEDRYSEYYY